MSSQIIGDALRLWVDHDEYLEGVSLAWDSLLEASRQDMRDSTYSYQAQAAINYTLTERNLLITAWMEVAGEDGRTSQEVEGLSPSIEQMTLLNQAETANNLHPVFRYLYVHAHLLNYLNGSGPLPAMVQLVESIQPA